MDDLDERKRVKAVTNLVGRHLWRCWSLHFDVIYSSSLPAFWREYRGTAPYLRHLKLECKVDDSDALRDEDRDNDEDEDEDEDEVEVEEGEGGRG